MKNYNHRTRALITGGAGFLVSHLCERLLRDGVDDLIDGFVRLMQMPADFTRPVNLGNPGEFTMIELAEKVKALTGSRSELVHKPLPTDDPQQRQPDIGLAREALGWQPSVTLEACLQPTIDYFDALLKKSSC